MAFVSLWWDLLITFCILLIVFYLYVKRVHGYWKRKGLVGFDPTFFVGNIGETFTTKKTMGEVFSDIYLKLKGKPYAGVYMFLRPTLMVNDLDQIKNIIVRDFAHFTDHSFEISDKHEPLAGHLFNLRGERWKNLRSKITPTFTTSKMRFMFESMDACANVMMRHLNDNIGKESVEDVKEVLAKFGTDVIGCCAFGIECNSFKDPNSKFRMMGKKIMHLPLHRAIYNFFFFFFPEIASKMKISIMGKDINDFFCNLVKETIEYREINNVTRNDFLQLLLELKKEDDTLLSK